MQDSDLKVSSTNQIYKFLIGYLLLILDMRTYHCRIHTINNFFKGESQTIHIFFSRRRADNTAPHSSSLGVVSCLLGTMRFFAINSSQNVSHVISHLRKAQASNGRLLPSDNNINIRFFINDFWLNTAFYLQKFKFKKTFEKFNTVLFSF